MTIALPVLGPEGWVTSQRDKLGIQFENLFTVDKSQSLLYEPITFSMAEILSRYPDDIEKTMEIMEEELIKYFGLSYASADVSVTPSKVQPHLNEAKVSLDVDVQVTDEEGKKYSLGTVLRQSNSNTLEYLIRNIEA